MTAAAWIVVPFLGGVGAVARFLLDGALQQRARWELPVGTFVVNVSGSFALGVLTGAGVGGNALLLAGTASLGSFTTFSTWMLESERLGEDGDSGPMAANLAVPLVVGFAAAAAGWAIGRML